MINKLRKNIRLSGFNYSQPGAYFITLCTRDKECVLGKIQEGNVLLTGIGEIAQKFWIEIPIHFSNVELDSFVIMPNHLHGIIIINDSCAVHLVGAQYIEPSQNKYQKVIPRSISSIIRSYKAAVTRCHHEKAGKLFGWQRNYYEHVIRNEDDLSKIREYIAINPVKRELDEENPDKAKKPIRYNI